MARFAGGDIVIVDWRGDAEPKEPNKVRPAVVVEDHTPSSDRHLSTTRLVAARDRAASLAGCPPS